MRLGSGYLATKERGKLRLCLLLRGAHSRRISGEAEGMEEEEDEEEITEDSLRVKPRPLPVSAWPTYSHIPPRRQGPKEHSYFYQEGKTGVVSIFDCIFKRPLDYNQKLHRDDREHAKSMGLKVNEEEWARPIGVLASSAYGRHIYKPVEAMNREHARVNHVTVEFYRKNAITCMEAPGFGHITPS